MITARERELSPLIKANHSAVPHTLIGTIQENSKRSPTSSGNGSSGITFAKVIETLAQLSG
jgi:hypothetical protein